MQVPCHSCAGWDMQSAMTAFTILTAMLVRSSATVAAGQTAGQDEMLKSRLIQLEPACVVACFRDDTRTARVTRLSKRGLRDRAGHTIAVRSRTTRRKSAGPIRRMRLAHKRGCTYASYEGGNVHLEGVNEATTLERERSSRPRSTRGAKLRAHRSHCSCVRTDPPASPARAALLPPLALDKTQRYGFRQSTPLLLPGWARTRREPVIPGGRTEGGRGDCARFHWHCAAPPGAKKKTLGCRIASLEIHLTPFARHNPR